MKTELKRASALGTLIVLGGDNIPWITTLEQAGWRCYRCSDLRTAESLLLEVGPCIGVVDLTQDNFSLNGIAGVVNRNKQARWLALVREEQLDTEATCQFIVNFCIDYFTSPVPESQLLKTIGHQLGMLRLERKVWPELGQFGQHGLQGNTTVMKKLRHQVKRMAAADMPVFVQGEIGTGKELVAQAIHQASTRAKGAFVTVSCEALNDSWLIDEGSLSNAGRCCFGAADKGVLFLDEISMLDDERQQELLRLLQDGCFTTVCGRQVTSDLRLIVSTRHTLEELLAEGKIREDLYYRLNVLGLAVPALRDRGEDIVLLAEYLLLKFARQYNSMAKSLSDEAQKLILSYPWPGNVRELISQLKRAILLAESKVIEADHLDLPRLSDDKQSLKTIREESERCALLSVLENNKGQISAAARELGVSRATMYRLLNKHDLVPPPRHFRQS
ncbi:MULTISPECIES: sigma-54-dependent transcriptional regulator [Photobacterium]|uniref:Sigma-54-dependent Fis family transcriptional regulator n=1 Tax=Photobacterium alginatilyticum TaxID=1775171 RepID=A0ABW9YFU3_9GAMM|nr:sigma-54 dependent transcriptional regulator [Photobacterium alginatilyticum]NBI52300.1 sigma-54-dependent Fis family transcriptional regulator [Photobacterium alginatilyticum]